MNNLSGQPASMKLTLGAKNPFFSAHLTTEPSISFSNTILPSHLGGVIQFIVSNPLYILLHLEQILVSEFMSR